MLLTEGGKCSGKLTKESDYESMDSHLCCGSGGGPGEIRNGGGAGNHGDNRQLKKWANRVHRAEFCGNTFPHLVTQVLLFQNPETIYTSKSYYKDHLEIWKETTATEAIWENYAKMLKANPDAHLEDKVKFLAAGIVIPAMRETQLNTYKRRNKKNKET